VRELTFHASPTLPPPGHPTFGAGLCDLQGDAVRVDGEGVVPALEVGVAPLPLLAG